MRLTIDVLRTLGSCGSYLETFRQQFPESDERYEDGVEPTPETCAAHAENFNWEWAYDTMLNSDGQRLYRERVAHDGEAMTAFIEEEKAVNQAKNADVQAWQSAHNQSSTYPDWDASKEVTQSFQAIQDEYSPAFNDITTRRNAYVASTFGHLVMQPELRSPALVRALGQVDGLREQRDRDELQDVQQRVNNTKSSIRSARSYVERYVRELSSLEEALPELERELVEARARIAKRALRRAERRIPRLREEYEVAQRRAEADLVAAQQRVAEITSTEITETAETAEA